MKVIIHADPTNFILAARAASSVLEKYPDRPSVVLSYGEGLDFSVVKNKASITVRHTQRYIPGVSV